MLMCSELRLMQTWPRWCARRSRRTSAKATSRRFATVDAERGGDALITQKAPGDDLRPARRPKRCSAQLDPPRAFERLVEEGVWREQGGGAVRSPASARALLTGERTALNFLAAPPGVATLAARALRAR